MPIGPSALVVLTHNRPEMLARCIAAAAPQTDLLIVIDNASQPAVSRWATPALREATAVSRILIRDEEQPPNLSRLWNVGLDRAERFFATARQPAAHTWQVALIGDDVVLPDGWVATVAAGLREHGAAAACTHQYQPAQLPIVKTAPDRDIMNRMTGWAFMVVGHKSMRADERLRWWWCDTHMDWQARSLGGMVILPGPVAVNDQPNYFTVLRPELAEQAGRDGETFAQIWGWRPW